jgi:hypothetical protein
VFLHHSTVDIFIIVWFGSRTFLDMRDNISGLDFLPAWAHEFLLIQFLVKDSLRLLEFKKVLWRLLFMRVILLILFTCLWTEMFLAIYSSAPRGWSIVLWAVHILLYIKLSL